MTAVERFGLNVNCVGGELLALVVAVSRSWVQVMPKSTGSFILKVAVGDHLAYQCGNKIKTRAVYHDS